MELKIEYVPVDTIRPYAGNAKLHPAEQVEQIKASIREFGFNDPIAVWNNEVVEGHGRLIAATEMGMDEVPIIRLDDLTDEQRRAYILVHNKLTLNSGFDKSMLELELDALNTIDAAVLGGKDKENVLGFYGQGTLGMNENFTDVDKMNRVYDGSGNFHPPRGNKSGTEAVTYHELGHALTDAIGKKYGLGDIDKAAATIVKNAYKKSGMKGGNRALAAKISGYAQKNYSECVAEAVADWYCNGNKASGASKLIMAELRSYK